MKAKNEKANAVEMGRELLSNAQDINNVLTVADCSPTFQGHYFNLETEKHGIANLIAEILTEREAIFPKGIEDSELRKVAIGAAMFTREIANEVKARFTAGTTRYPLHTIEAYLSIFMRNSGKVGKIQLKGHEDKPRPCYKPRCKWYLIQD